MPGSFLGEMAALWWGERLGSFDPGASSAVAPTISPPAHPVSDPPPNDPPAAPPFAVSFPSPTPPPDTPTPGGILSGTYDLTPINLGFGSHVAYNPPAVTLDLPHPTVAPTATPSDSTPPQSKTPFVTPDGVDAPKSDPITPGKSAKGGVSSFADSNQPPVANDDSYTVIHDQQLDVDATNGLLSNDYDYENDPLGIVVVSLPSNGTIDFQSGSVSGDGSFQYLPDNGYVGTDTFTYKVYDATGESSVATVSIIVTNTAPVAAADSFTINEDQVLNAGDLLANDTDADGDPLGTTLVSSPTNGELQLNEDGTFTYTPNVNFVGTDSFTYSTTDGLVGTSPQTVSITVQSAGPFDLDGRDDSTLTTWMSEPDEAAYGLGVSVGNPATLTPRVHDLPSGWSITGRRILFAPSVVSVGGATGDGVLELSAGGGNEILTVAALTTGFESTDVWYEITGTQSTGGPFGLAFITRIPMQVVEKKAKVTSVEFTSGETTTSGGTTVNLLRRNGGKQGDLDYLKAGDSYKSEWTPAAPNAQIIQVRNTAAAASKVKVKVKFTVAGDLKGKEVILEGTSTENSLKFTSDKFTLPANGGEVEQTLTATNEIGSDIRTIKASIAWKVAPTGAANAVQMGSSGADTNFPHVIFVTYGKPQAKADGIDDDALIPTPARMQRAIGVFAKAFVNAKTAANTNDPKPQRIVFEAVQLHVFNFDNHVFASNPKIGKGGSYCWAVYDGWTKNLQGLKAKGSDCISGAGLITATGAMVGMPGTIAAKMYSPKSAAASGTAVEFNPDPMADPNRYRNNGKEILGLSDAGSFNAFEGTVKYVSGDKTFYFPVVPNKKYSVDSADKVLRSLTEAAWFTNNPGNYQFVVAVPPPYVPLAAADFYSVD